MIAPGPAGLEVYHPQLRYVLIDENAYADADLASMRNRAAALFRLETRRDPETVREVLTALASGLAASEQAELRYSFLVWLREAFFRTRLPGMGFPELNDLEEARIMLTERVVDWTQQWKQEGRQEGEATMLRRLLICRFGALPAWADEQVARASIEELEIWGERILDAATLMDVLGHPGH